MTATNMEGASLLEARQHIQNHSAADKLEPHWGYADRVVPCVNDPGSCAYLDSVYWSHDVGMLYVGIFWATVAGIVLIWALGHRVSPHHHHQLNGDAEKDTAGAAAAARPGRLARLRQSVAAYGRAYLLPESARFIFGPTTRLQVLILAIIVGYLTIWTFVGITYEIWVTPVKNMPGVYNTRTWVGPISDRFGVLAYGLTPLSVMLASRESVLSLLTGVPYQSFNFLHRWLGYVIFVQSSIHTVGWCVVEIRLYQPQPSVAVNWIKQLYMIWGVVAMILLLLLFALSTKWGIRLTGYETFRKLHYVLAMVYIGACWGHWANLKCFMAPSLAIWFLDRLVRLVRSGLIHYQYLPDGSMGFRSSPAAVALFPDAEHGDVVRLDFRQSQEAWRVGQHFYLCFTEGSLWQSHPFTPLSLPVVRDGTVQHSYIFRAKGGETKKIAALAAKKLAEDKLATTPVILQGPYGESLMESLAPGGNVLCVAGGTGITYVLPVLLDLARGNPVADRSVELVWAVRREHDTAWVGEELQRVREAAAAHSIRLRIFVTREEVGAVEGAKEVESSKEVGEKECKVVAAATTNEAGSSSCSSVSPAGSQSQPAELEVQYPRHNGHRAHPDLAQIVSRFVEGTVRGPTTVYASGPGSMISDLRSAVAACNSGARVWKGESRFDVNLVCDDRLEW